LASAEQEKVTLTYVLLVTAAVAVFLAMSRNVPFDLWLAHMLAYIGSVTLGLHAIARTLQFPALVRWMFVVLVPVGYAMIEHWYLKEFERDHAYTLGGEIVFLLSSIGNLAAYAILIGVFNTALWYQRATQVSVDQSSSGDQVGDDPSVDVGQSEVASGVAER